MIGLDALSLCIGAAIGIFGSLLARALVFVAYTTPEHPPATARQIRRARQAARADLARSRGGR